MGEMIHGQIGAHVLLDCDYAMVEGYITTGTLREVAKYLGIDISKEDAGANRKRKIWDKLQKERIL